MFEEQFVSAAEAGRRTGQSERTIRRWIERGKLETIPGRGLTAGLLNIWVYPAQETNRQKVPLLWAKTDEVSRVWKKKRD